MKIDILTLFPAMFDSPLGESIIKRAQDKGLLSVQVTDIRSYAEGKHLQVDDYPYGGGAGMVMKPDVVARAIQACRINTSRVIYLTPRGRTLNQDKVRELAEYTHIILLCGHYEGIDQRALASVDEEISIGDYILTGGEIPAMVVVDSVARFIPGVLGHDESIREESFSVGLLEYPHYTRPPVFQDMNVPPVLLSGHHEQIRVWRKKQSLLQTLLKRPDLLLNRTFDVEERRLMEEILFSEEPGHDM